MSKIKEIESAILQLDGGRFQTLVDQYLYRKFKFSNIQHLGSHTGTDKTTQGTPDSYSRTQDGKYIAIMYGAYPNKNDAFKKVKSDIESCLNTVNNSDLYKLVCCHTSSNFSIEQDKELHSLFGNTTIIGINTIANDLYYKYPALARDILSVDIDTNQILMPIDFIKENNNSIYRTPLDVKLLGREEDVSELYNLLKNNEIIVVSGPSGVGKTKLSFDVCKSFSENENYKFYIVKNRNLPIYNDVKTYFEHNNNYLIMVDDANQLTDLQFILELINNFSDTFNIKILLTVRDYAKKETLLKIKDYAIPQEYSIKPLEDSIVKDILISNLNIINTDYLNQIIDISKGNIRIAYMAGMSSKEEGNFSNIQNAEDIFETFFKYIFKALTNKDEIKILAIIAFVESFEINNKESLVYEVAKLNNISDDEVKDACNKFHELEIVDIYENLAAKFSEQNLGDFIIFYVFIKNHILPLDTLIKTTFPKIKEKVIYHLNTCIKLFYSKITYDYISETIKSIWIDIKTNIPLAYEYAKSFHNLIDNEVLLFLKQEIKEVEENHIDLLNINFDKNNNISRHEILDILSGYKMSDNYDSALQLIIEFFQKDNSLYSEIFEVLTDNFAIDTDSYKYNYKRELEIMNYLYKRYTITPNDEIALLCISYASDCLKYIHETTESCYKTHKLNFIRYTIANCDGIKELHQSAITILAYFFDTDEYKKFSLKCLHEYNPCGIKSQLVDDNLLTIVEYDSNILEKSFSKILDMSNILDCNLLHHFENHFEKNNISYSTFFNNWKSNEYYKLILDLQKINFSENTEKDEEIEQEYTDAIKKRISKMPLSKIEKMLSYSKDLKISNEYIFCRRLSKIISKCEINKFLDYLDLLIKYMPNNYFTKDVIKRLISDYGFKKSFEWISKYNIAEIKNWFNEFINQIPNENISTEYCNYILESIKINPNLYNLEFDTVCRINNIEPTFFADYVNVLRDIFNNCAKENSNIVASFLEQGLMSYRNEKNKFINLFLPKQLKKLYIISLRSKSYFDYDNFLLEELVKNDITIINELVDLYFANTNDHETLNRLKFFWKTDCYLSLIEYTISYLFDKSSYSFVIVNCIETVFKTNDTDPERILEVLEMLIKKYINEVNKLKCILQSFESLSKEVRLKIIKYTCSLNNSIELFKNCPIAPYPNWGWSGSEVPILENRIKECEELINILKGADFIEHRAYCEEYINSLRTNIKKVIAREFLYDF